MTQNVIVYPWQKQTYLIWRFSYQSFIILFVNYIICHHLH